MQASPHPKTRPSLRLLPGGADAAPHHAGLRRGLLWGGTAYRLLLAAFVTGFVLVDDAYIHLRYARHFAEGTGFVYNAGERVFGLTSPLYGLLASCVHFVVGTTAAPAMLAIGVLLWTAAAHLATCDLPSRLRPLTLALLTLSPVFVDNQLLGMETPLFALLLVVAVREAAAGRARTSAAAQGLCLITRPEAVLLAPFLLLALAGARGWRAGLRDLVRPATLLLLLGPGLIWAAVSLGYYGHLLPQSMVAKSGWNSTHYDSLYGLEWALFTAPRLTYLPFLDYFPRAAQFTLAAALHAGIVLVGWVNLRHGDRQSRTWFGFYLAYVAFYLVGKGATEASWYAVPSSVALTLAAAPLLGRLPVRCTGALATTAVVIALGSVATFAAWRRAPLLRSYVEGYGACADYLNEHAPEGSRVLIGEIGVFGYRSQHAVIDVGALVSPEVLPVKNDGVSFVELTRRLSPTHVVLSDIALQKNHYPSVGPVFASEADRATFEAGWELLATFEDKHVYALAPSSR